MTQEDKDLLLKDICCRLPYKVMAKYYDLEDECETWDEIEGVESNEYVEIGQYSLPIEAIKPYLFPISSMTEEQKNEFDARTFEIMFGEFVCKKKDEMEYGKLMAFDLDFYNKYHLDWRGLIPKGLAIDATGLGIYE